MAGMTGHKAVTTMTKIEDNTYQLPRFWIYYGSESSMTLDGLLGHDLAGVFI
jgi:hypothetical protein